ncbi:hypothetical protein Nizo2726_1143 [Lactiplantibacillus plantarum]|nr:hypothetical protein I526_2797 [Lactiplantibacillus plantarum DOMLa]KZU33722.1 hypothetical protein Nizo2726_1143 [Lactiplantibacillus plantarum]KZU66967.1 hypothetical protein Nizo2831_0823 [Lactiplantibacillus plantarum]KZU67953.1 hypothetical protein Nizo2830_0773 [Lactiplantibacillus plantarum]
MTALRRITLKSTASGRPLAIFRLNNGSNQQQLTSSSSLPLRTDFQRSGHDVIAPN